MTTTATPKKKKRFRIQAKSLFLTYPKCPIGVREALLMITSKKLCTVCIVGQEEHQDGSSHLHVYLAYGSKIDITTMSYFDLSQGGVTYHGNYQATRSVSRTVKYVTKGGMYSLHGISEAEVQAIIRSKQGYLSEKISRLDDYTDITKVCEDMPEFYFKHSRKIARYMTMRRQIRMRNSRIPIIRSFQQEEPEGLDFEEGRLYDWLRDNLGSGPRKRRKKQLYLWSETGFGKTELICRLAQHYSVYPVPNEDFYDEWQDGIYDIAVLDEFIGKKRITWMNKWLEGQVMTLRKKGSQYVKYKNVPTIVLSNVSLEDCYRKVAVWGPAILEALRRRFVVIKLVRKMNYFIDQCLPLSRAKSISNRPSPELLSPTPPENRVLSATGSLDL